MHGAETVPPPGYGPVAKALHWLVVALLAVQFAIAWTMPDVRHDTRPEGLIALHLSVGTLIMLVIVIRIAWRLAHPVPPAKDAAPEWQRRAAAITHILLYVLLILLPMLGWANASSRGFPVGLFGVVPLPALLATDFAFGHWCGNLHTLVSYILLGVVGLHVMAALYHRIVLRDGVLARMLPRRF